MVTISDSWRSADKAQMAVSGAMESAALMAAAGNANMAWMYLHAARHSAEILAGHLEQAAEELRAPVVFEEREGLEDA